MTNRYNSHTILAAFVAASLVGGLTASKVSAQGSCCSKGNAGTSSVPDCHAGASSAADGHRQSSGPRDAPPFEARHGGQLSKTVWNYYEVVYGATESRVYVYDMFRYPVSAKGIEGSAVMRVRSTGKEYRYRLAYVSASASDPQDYLAIRVGLTRVRDGDMDVQFDLARLPNQDAPTARFRQTFAMSGRVHQTGEILASGRQQTETSNPGQNSAKRSALMATDATAADRPAMERQGKCPVMGSTLGEHGTPVKVSLDGRAVFVCCRGCIETIKGNPGQYLAHANG